ncbi:hypothetical protein ACVGVM_26075 [Pseudonocardia bannensis]|uniref:Uncharacterized protein n=1 Tax=Pseudonocardia bannensis TaxID=630973 RepID=A0A848DPM8_9PSEU|nr:hypothetical protein [Pseudonocardia bannensis]NMH94396.1 hypothetical protein [Pseudonocardia bannensis]
MTDEFPVHPKHAAKDRFGKGALHAAHDITAALAEAGVEDDGAVVLRTDGKRPKLADLEKLLDDTLAEDADDAPAPGNPEDAPETGNRGAPGH